MSSNSNETNSDIDEDVIGQFKFMITIVFLVLFFFLAYFVYNLIKCYLPKWRNKKLQEDSLQPAKISQEVKKNEIMIEL